MSIIKSYSPIVLPIIGLALLWLVLFLCKQLGFAFTLQPSNSMPKGIYLAHPCHFPLKRGNIVLLDPSRTIRSLMEKNHWLPAGAPLLKSIAALPGDSVCIKNNQIWIDGQKRGPVFKQDHDNHPLPSYSFCDKLPSNQWLVLGTQSPQSFDSRYFGPIHKQQIQSCATPIWTTTKRFSHD